MPKAKKKTVKLVEAPNGLELKEKFKRIFNEHNQIFVEQWVSLFRQTKNPIYIWKAYQSARGYALPVPDEVLQYLDEAARGIIRIANDPPKPNVRPLAVAKAFGLAKTGKGAGSVFDKYKDRKQEKEIALSADAGIREFEKAYIAFEEVAEQYDCSASSVRRIYYKHLEVWKEIAADFVKHKIITFTKEGHAELAFPLPGDATKIRELASILDIAEQTKKYPA